MKKQLALLLSVIMAFSCFSTAAFAADEPTEIAPTPQEATASDATAAEAIKLGDVNMDKKVSVIDAKWVLQNVAKMKELNDSQSLAADVTLDGRISVADAKWILQCVAGLRELGEINPNGDVVEPDGDEMKALKDAIAQAKAVDAAGYTAQSVEALDKAIADAEALAGKNNVTAQQIDEAVKALEDAQKGLETDTAPLEKAISDSYLKDTSNYLPGSVDNFYAAVAEAEKVLNGKDITPKQVSDAVAAIKAAEANLVPKPDKTELEAAINEAEAVETDGMTPESIESFNNAIKAAKAVYNNDNSTAEEVEAATKALKDAQNALDRDYKALLTAKKDEVEALDLTGYTQETKDAVNTAMEQANAILENPDSTQEEAQKAYEALEDAVNALEIDTTEFDAAYKAATEVDPTGYTSNSVSALKAAIENADEVKANAEAAVEDYAQATEQLNNAIEGLAADLSKLKNLMRNCSDYLGDRFSKNYTKASIAALQEAYDNASEITEKNTPAEVQEAYDALEEAKNNLVRLADDFDVQLFNALLSVSQKTKFEDYTEETANALRDAIAQAEIVAAKEEKTQAEVKEATDALTKARDGLVKNRADTSALEAKIAEVTETYSEDDYTDESYQALTEALSAAQDVVDSDTPTASQVQQAMDDIDSAVEALESIDDALAAALADAEEITKEDYTQQTADALDAAVKAAQSPTNKKQALKDLEDAIAALKPNKTALDAAISKATAIERTDYTEDSLETLDTALTNARAKSSDDTASVDDVKTATSELEEAIKGLKADKTKLEERITKARAIDTKDCTEKTVQALTEALAQGDKVMQNNSATPDDVKGAIEAITKAVRELGDKYFDDEENSSRVPVIDWRNP